MDNVNFMHMREIFSINGSHWFQSSFLSTILGRITIYLELISSVREGLMSDIFDLSC